MKPTPDAAEIENHGFDVAPPSTAAATHAPKPAPAKARPLAMKPAPTAQLPVPPAQAPSAPISAANFPQDLSKLSFKELLNLKIALGKLNPEAMAPRSRRIHLDREQRVGIHFKRIQQGLPVVDAIERDLTRTGTVLAQARARKQHLAELKELGVIP